MDYQGDRKWYAMAWGMQHESSMEDMKMKERKPKFGIGQQYSTLGKHPRLCTVIDILKTYNSKGEMVQLRYVSTHEFVGQTITNYDVPETSIVRGIESYYRQGRRKGASIMIEPNGPEQPSTPEEDGY